MKLQPTIENFNCENNEKKTSISEEIACRAEEVPSLKEKHCS